MTTFVFNSIQPLIGHITNALFTAENRRLKKAIENIMRQNEEAYKEKLDGFHYLGEFYRPEGLRGKLHRKVLHPSLEPVMDRFLIDRATVKADEQNIRQVLFLLLQNCMTSQDVRDALPDCLTDTLPDWGRNLERRFEVAHTIRGNRRAQRQYEKVLPRLEFYSAARLLY